MSRRTSTRTSPRRSPGRWRPTPTPRRRSMPRPPPTSARSTRMRSRSRTRLRSSTRTWTPTRPRPPTRPRTSTSRRTGTSPACPRYRLESVVSPPLGAVTAPQDAVTAESPQSENPEAESSEAESPHAESPQAGSAHAGSPEAGPPASAPARPPALADGLELLGTMPGSGYRESPSLVRRADGQTLQLTSLLYETLACVNGSRSYERIAAELLERIGRKASADNVRFLVEKKLRP